MAEQKKNRLVEIFTKDYKYEGIVLLVLSIIAIIVGVSILSITQPVFFNITGTTLGWLLIVLGAISLLLSIWPYYKPSVYEVKRVSWPNKKTMLENVLSVFIFMPPLWL